MRVFRCAVLVVGTFFFCVGLVWAAQGGARESYGLVMAPAAVMLAWVGSMEWRLRSKVSQRLCDNVRPDMKDRMTRIESHIYDLLRERKIKPTMDPPEEIRNNRQ